MTTPQHPPPPTTPQHTPELTTPQHPPAPRTAPLGRTPAAPDTTVGQPVIRVRDMTMSYGGTEVLRGIDLDIHRGDVFALLGPNGAGKTTTVEILEGFRQRSAGEVQVLGVDPERGDDAWRGRIGLVLQSWRDHRRWRVWELLTHFAMYYPDPRDPAELLTLVGLTGQADQPVDQLSGGQRRRLDVALGIIGRPELLFLDEPTTGFDPQARREFHELVERLSHDEGVTVLLTTHDLVEAERLADRIAMLVNGRIRAFGTPSELARRAAAQAEVRWTAGDGTSHRVPTEDPSRLVWELHQDTDGPIAGLEVRRPTLEDTYLHMLHRADEPDTACHTDAAEAPASVNAPASSAAPATPPAPEAPATPPAPEVPASPVVPVAPAALAAQDPADTPRGLDTPNRVEPSRRPTPRYWRVGFLRGQIESRQLLRSAKELSGHLTNVVIALLIAAYVSGEVPGTDTPMSHLVIAGFAAYLLFQVGLINLPQMLVTEREEGVLLRLRATPGGIPAYLVAKCLLVVVTAVSTLALLLAAGALFADGPLPKGTGGWLTLMWVSTLGLLAVVPLGAAIGAVLPNPREALALIMLPTMGLLMTSGVVFPITSLPVVVQQVASAFPLKWMAQGLRSALLPDSARAAEAAGSWELPMVALVLTAWAVLGFLLAVPLLRRAARRESGSRMTARHRKAVQSGAMPE